MVESLGLGRRELEGREIGAKWKETPMSPFPERGAHERLFRFALVLCGRRLPSH
jgi:hypothetical protein